MGEETSMYEWNSFTKVIRKKGCANDKKKLIKEKTANLSQKGKLYQPWFGKTAPVRGRK